MRENSLRTFVALDIEASGMNPQQDSIIEIGACKVVDGVITDVFETFVSPKQTLDPLITIITGINDSDLIDAPSFDSISSRLKDFIGDLPVLGHNVVFDLNFLVSNGLVLTNPIWDTYILSTILFPKFRSHSLESLSRLFDIEHIAHRALGDAKATAHLWLHLLSEIAVLDNSLKSVLLSFGEKSTWGMKDVFSYSYADPAYSPIILSGKVKHIESSIDIDVDQPSLLLECFGVDKQEISVATIDNLLASQKRVLLVGAYFFNIDSILSHFIEKSGDSIGFYYDRPASYLDWDVFHTLISKEILTDEELILILKILRSFKPGQIVHRGELSLVPQDNNLWGQICCHSESQVFRDLSARLDAVSLVCMSHFGFFQRIREDADFLERFSSVVFLDVHLLEQNITRSFGTTLSLEDAEGDEEAFLRNMYQWASSSVPDSPYPQAILLNEGLKNSTYKQLSKDSENLDSESVRLFFQNDENIRWIWFDNQGRFSFHVDPLHVDKLFKEAVLDRKDHVLIGDRGFFGSVIGFSGERREISSDSFRSLLTVHVPEIEEITGSKKEGDTPTQLAYIERLLDGLPGRTALVFGSRRVLQKFFLALQPLLIEKNIPFIAEGISGGRGKMAELFEQYFSGERMLLFCTHRYLPLFLREDIALHNMIIQTLPFDPFGDPVFQARNAVCNNGFVEYVLPRALQNFGVMCEKFTLDEEPKKLVFIDRRIREKSYASAFIDFFR